MTVRSEDILKYLTKEILGATNFDPNLDKWEIEGEKIPKTFFSDRLRNNSDSPINKEVVGRLVKLYRAQLGLYKMKHPIDDTLSCNYANKLADYMSGILIIDLSCFKHYPADTGKKQKKREVLVNILSILLTSVQDKVYFENTSIKNTIQGLIDNYKAEQNEEIIKKIDNKQVLITNDLFGPETRLHLAEAKGKCPRCGAKLIRQGNKSVVEAYDLVLINKMKPNTSENRLIVCKNCYEELKDDISESEIIKLENIKRQLYLDNLFSNHIDNMVIEQEIEEVLNSLDSISHPDELTPLDYDPKKVEEKIDDDYLLQEKVRSYVIKYYNFVGEKLKELNNENKLKYFLISNEIKILYITLAGMKYSKNEIFDLMTEWLMKKAKCRNKVACEIIIAYYVQNCEVFGEITE